MAPELVVPVPLARGDALIRLAVVVAVVDGDAVAGGSWREREDGSRSSLRDRDGSWGFSGVRGRGTLVLRDLGARGVLVAVSAMGRGGGADVVGQTTNRTSKIGNLYRPRCVMSSLASNPSPVPNPAIQHCLAFKKIVSIPIAWFPFAFI